MLVWQITTLCIVIFDVFFFSSRRRHTRSKRDWSSDVCSSDLYREEMVMGYTEEKLNSLDKETIIQLFLAQQEQLRQIDQNLQLVLEQLADQKRRRFGRSSEKHETEGQIAFMEVDGTIVFFNEAEAVAAESADDSLEEVPRQRPKKKRGKREEDLKGLPVIVVEHSMEEKELEQRFGQGGWKQ